VSEPLTGKPWWRRKFGTRSERAAADFLKGLGYQILAENYRTAAGELDLVAQDRDIIVFVEVRSTEESDSNRAAASVDFVKQKRLTKLALQYLQEHKLLGKSARFDVLAISWPPGEDAPAVRHFRNAFEAVGRFQMFS
jgi:putative endonuclease